MEISEKHKEIIGKLADMPGKFVLACHDEDKNTTVYSRIDYASGLGFIGTIIDAFMENTVPAFGRDKVIRDLQNTVNFAIDQNNTQISKESQKILDGLADALKQGGKQ